MTTTAQSRSDGDSFSVAALILGAGSSRRMGTAKLLLPWGGTSIVGHLIGQCQALAAAQVAIVIANGAVELRTELDRLNFPRKNLIVNSVPECGMFGSIQCGASWRGWSESVTHWLILLGDQPHLQPTTLQQLIAFAAQNRHKVCQPRRQSSWRHPVMLTKDAFGRLGSSTADTMREFLQGCERAGFECLDPGLDQDIDTPEDYRKAAESFGPQGFTGLAGSAV